MGKKLNCTFFSSVFYNFFKFSAKNSADTRSKDPTSLYGLVVDAGDVEADGVAVGKVGEAIGLDEAEGDGATGGLVDEDTAGDDDDAAGAADAGNGDAGAAEGTGLDEVAALEGASGEGKIIFTLACRRNFSKNPCSFSAAKTSITRRRKCS